MILAFGDSLTYGTGAPAQHAYPRRLAAATGRVVINAGLPGETSAQARRRLPQLLQRYHPTQVILCSGANDFIQRLNVAAVRDNLAGMIELLQQQQIEVILLAVPHYGVSSEPAPLYHELAQHYHLKWDEHTLSTIVRDETLRSDLVHPNSAGYQRMADSVELLLTGDNH